MWCSRRLFLSMLLHVSLVLNLAVVILGGLVFAYGVLLGAALDAWVLIGAAACVTAVFNCAFVLFLNRHNFGRLRWAAIGMNTVVFGAAAWWCVQQFFIYWEFGEGSACVAIVLMTSATSGLWWLAGGSPLPTPGECPGCGYSLSGLPTGVCPECGWEAPSECAVCGYDRSGIPTGARCPECGAEPLPIRGAPES
jgi:hypothetical protein